MKTLEELANSITATSIADLVPKIILQEVEEAARARRFGRNLVRINDDLVRTKGRSITIGRRGTVTATQVSEGTDLSSATENITYLAHTLTPYKIGVGVAITQESIEAVELNLIKDSVLEAGIAIALKEDTDILQALMYYSVGSATLGGAGTFWLSAGGTNGTIASGSAVGAIVYADETQSNLTSVNYYTGKIITAGACTVAFWQSQINTAQASGDVPQTLTLTNFTDALAATVGGTWNVNGYIAVATGAAAVRARKWIPKIMILHPAALGAILSSNMFIDAAHYGSNEPILNGEIGKLSGMKVLVTTQQPTGCAMLVDPDRAGWMAVRRNLDMKRWDNPRTDSIELYFYLEYQAQLTDPDAIQYIVNITGKAVDT
jgi:hypothetical protein